MGKAKGPLSGLNVNEVQWLHAFIEKCDGIDSLPGTERLDNHHIAFCVRHNREWTLNQFWNALIAVRKMPEKKKQNFGLSPSSKRKKHQRYVKPSVASVP